jgi:hypothetical protein
MNLQLTMMKDLSPFMKIFINEPTLPDAKKAAQVHALASGAYQALDAAHKKEFDHITNYLWMAATQDRKAFQSKQLKNPVNANKWFEDDRPDSAYNAKELELGVKHEYKEHIPNIAFALKLTKDHLDLIPNYYTLQEIAEKKLKAQKTNPKNTGEPRTIDYSKFNPPRLYLPKKSKKNPIKKIVNVSTVKKLEKMAGIPKDPLIIQSVTIPKTWGLTRAKKFLKHLNLKYSKVDTKPNVYRFRQHPPSQFKDYFSKTVMDDNDGKVVLTLGKLKKHFAGKYNFITKKSYETLVFPTIQYLKGKKNPILLNIAKKVRAAADKYITKKEIEKGKKDLDKELSKVEPKVEQKTNPKKKNPTGKKPNLLIVDDNGICVITNEAIASAFNFEIKTAYNGLEAIKLLPWADCVCTDGDFPYNRDFYDALIKRNIPYVVNTGNTSFIDDMSKKLNTTLKPLAVVIKGQDLKAPMQKLYEKTLKTPTTSPH